MAGPFLKELGGPSIGGELLGLGVRALGHAPHAAEQLADDAHVHEAERAVVGIVRQAGQHLHPRAQGGVRRVAGVCRVQEMAEDLPDRHGRGGGFVV